MTQPQQPPQQPEEQPGSLAGPATVALGLSALAAGLPDPWLPARLRHFVAILRGERAIHTAFTQVVDEWRATVAPRVVAHGTVDAQAARSTASTFAHHVQVEVLEKPLLDLWKHAYEAAGGWEPDSTHYAQQYLRSVANRMSNTPQATFDLIRAETLKAVNEGDSVDELAERIDKILRDGDLPNWANRAMTIARTETLGAYNAGTLTGWKSYAKQTGGAWEKAWLCTHDERTRPTHLAADISGTDAQRVPLDEPFAVGDALLDHPGAVGPAAMPGEVINCRCSMVLLRPGEGVDLGNRHFRRLP